MSAFIVEHEHINVMVWAGLRYVDSPYYPLRWFHGNPETRSILDYTTSDETGHMLLAENVASVNYRYNEKTSVPDYYYEPPRHTSWSLGELFNAIACYEYQSCEHPSWDTSQAHQFCRALKRHLIHAIPGYTNGPWAIDGASMPHAEQPTNDV